MRLILFETDTRPRSSILLVVRCEGLRDVISGRHVTLRAIIYNIAFLDRSANIHNKEGNIRRYIIKYYADYT
jgi:hypothetical protein